MSKFVNEVFVNKKDWILVNLEDLVLSSSECSLVLLIQLMNEHQLNYSIDDFANKLKVNTAQIDEMMNSLHEKGYLTIRIENNKVVYDLSGLYEMKPMDPFKQNLFELFEQEFKRPLTQSEFAKINEWNQSYEEKMIVFALREAVLRNAMNLNYINSILVNWKKEGKSVESIEKESSYE